MTGARPPVTARPLDGRDLTPLLILAGLALVVLVAADLWAAATVAAGLAGQGWQAPPFGPLGTGVLARAAHGAAALAPGSPAWLVWTLTALPASGQVAAALWLTRRLLRRWQASADPAAAMGGPAELAALTSRGAAGRARTLRPSLAGGGAVDPGDLGLRLGRFIAAGAGGRQQPAYGSWEDVYVLIMAPRSGKTVCYAIPYVLAAPGPALLTSNKADAWAATAELRARVGQIWTFDPQQIAYAAQRWWWDPLAGVTTVEEADRLASHFVQDVSSERDPFWGRAASDLFTAVLLAAARSHGTMQDVWRWLCDTSGLEAIEALTAAGDHDVAEGLRGLVSGAPETTLGIFQTARTAARCLRAPEIMRWVTPPAAAVEQPLPQFDPAAFVVSTDTLYLLSKDGAGSASPLVAALTDRVFRSGVRAAEARGGRLDPPLLPILDEAANVCRVRDLPDLYSHLGSRGIPVVTILQSFQQATRVWGQDGAGALWGAATVKLVGAGVDDPRFAADVAALVGKRYLPYRSVSQSASGWSQSDSPHQEPILDTAQVRALPKGSVLLLATGQPVAMLTTEPWFTGPHAAQINHAIRTANAEIAQRAAAAAAERPSPDPAPAAVNDAEAGAEGMPDAGGRR